AAARGADAPPRAIGANGGLVGLQLSLIGRPGGVDCGPRSARRNDDEWMAMKLPDPALLLVTDRHQARRPLADIVRAALLAGCRWMSVREKDLSDDDQIALVSTLLPIARRHGARLTLHGDAALAKACGSDGVHLPAGSDPAASRALLGPDKLLGVSLHTVTEAEAIDRS